MPRRPAPGPLDVAFSLILHRALPFSPRSRHEALRARLGWGPDRPVGQREAGARIGLSHQRLAQLERRVLDVLAATGPPPSLDRALELLVEKAPCTSAVAATALYAERVTGEVIHPAGVLVAAAAAGAACRVEITALAAGRTAVVPVGSSTRQAAVAAAASRRLAGIGVLRLSRLLAEEGTLSEVEAEAALLGAHRVGRTGDVLWWRDDRSSMLVRPLQRMLAALGQLPIERLVDGVARNWRYRRRDAVPDRDALTAYLAAQPAYRQGRDGRWALSGFSRTETAELLLPEDQAALRLLWGRPSREASRRELLAALASIGYARSGLPLLIGTSPLLVRVGSGRYALTA